MTSENLVMGAVEFEEDELAGAFWEDFEQLYTRYASLGLCPACLTAMLLYAAQAMWDAGVKSASEEAVRHVMRGHGVVYDGSPLVVGYMAAWGERHKAH
jgi:hypothetical protein